jgi:heptosyltransferase-1
MRILITRLSHIGDCILTLPLVSAIKRKYPAAVVVWAVESPTQQLLGLHPGIDEIVVVPKGWLKSPASWRSLSKKLKSFKIDTVIDPQGLTKSAMLGRISGAKKRIGIRGQWGRELSPWLNNCLVESVHPHIVDRSLALLSELGIENLGLRRATEKKPPNFREVEAPAMPCSTARLNEVRFELPVCPEAKRSVDAFLHQKGFVPASAPLSQSWQPTQSFAVINPGGSWASKRWETDRFATVASGLFQQHGILSVVTWAGNEDHRQGSLRQHRQPFSRGRDPPADLRRVG